MNNMVTVMKIFKSVFYFGTLNINKLIFLCCYFMFKFQMVFLESSYILTLISVANVFEKCFVSDILRYIKIIFEMQIFMTH